MQRLGRMLWSSMTMLKIIITGILTGLLLGAILMAACVAYVWMQKTATG